MKRKLAICCLIHTCVLTCVSAPLMAQESGDAATTAPVMHNTTLSFNPVGLVFLPELRLLYERAIFDGTGSLLMGASLGSRYYLWGLVTDGNRFFVYETRPRIGRVHGQVRKYRRGTSFEGWYVAGEGRVSYMIENLSVFDFERDTYVTIQERTLSTGGLVFGGWKHIAESGLTYDLSLGGGVEISNLEASLTIEPRFALGWSY